MPFKSKAQRRWMYANKPGMAERWQKETPSEESLPEHAPKKEKRAFLGFGVPVKEWEGEHVRPNISIGFPYLVSANLAMARGIPVGEHTLHPSIGLGLTGPNIGLQIRRRSLSPDEIRKRLLDATAEVAQVRKE